MQIAVLHFNENSNRIQAQTQDGVKRHSIVFPKFKKGEHTVKKIMTKATHSKCNGVAKQQFFAVYYAIEWKYLSVMDLSHISEYVEDLKEKVVNVALGNVETVTQRPAAPKPVCSEYVHPDKEVAVAGLVSRYKTG